MGVRFRVSENLTSVCHFTCFSICAIITCTIFTCDILLCHSFT